MSRMGEATRKTLSIMVHTIRKAEEEESGGEAEGVTSALVNANLLSIAASATEEALDVNKANAGLKDVSASAPGLVEGTDGSPEDGFLKGVVDTKVP